MSVRSGTSTAALLFWSLIACAFSVQAGEWVSTGGPLGGLGYDVRIHPRDKNKLYVTDNFAGVVRSDDAGATWRPSNNGITARGGPTGDVVPIFSLTVDPNNPDIIWAGTNGDGALFGIFKSIDGGDNWNLKSNGVTAPPDGIVFRGFTVRPGNSSVVYAMAEVRTGTRGREFDRVKGRVYKTVNGGESWNLLWEGNDLARYLIIDPGNNATLYVSAGIFDREAYNSDCSAFNYGGVGVQKSTDGGTTWLAINNGISSLYVGSLRMHPSNPLILFAAAGNNACSGGREGNEQGGLFRTTDGGTNWTKVISRDIVTTVNFAPSNPDVIYAGSARAFYRSTDGGTNWSQYSKPGAPEWGPEGVRAGVPIDVVVDPSDPNLVYVNNYGGGVFRSTDGARTWEIWSKGYSGAWINSVHIPPASPSTVLAIGRSGPFRSVNYGGNWVGIGTGQAAFSEWNTAVSDPRDSRVILLADEHQGKILRSTDAGASFSVVFTHPQANANELTTRQGFKTFAVAASKPDTIYAGLARERNTLEQGGTPAGTVIYLTTDAGRSFVASGSSALDGKNVRKLLVHPTQAETVWAATSGGVYKTTDGAANWALLGLGGKNIAALAVDAPNNMIVAAEKDVGIWLNENGSAAWTGPITVGFSSSNPYVMALVFDDAGTLYAGDQYSGVYSSRDRGRTWAPFPDKSMTGLGVRTPLDLAAGGGMIYVATLGGGVFRYGSLPSAPHSITGTATGTLRARALSVALQPTIAELGSNRKIFIAGVLGSQFFFLTPTGWQPWTSGVFPAYTSGAIATQTIRVFDGSLDLSFAAGAQIYVGYGTDDADMLTSGRYARVHTLE